jgi:RNA polymerase sigma factor (sigma-70 family)
MLKIEEVQKNPSLFDNFIVENQGLIRSVIKRYFGYVLNTTEFDDYCQVGNIGLFTAVERFKPEFGNAFSTYAVPMIIGEIKRYQRDVENNQIKVPRSLKELSYKVQNLFNAGKVEDEICKELNIDSKKYADAINVKVLYLDEIVGNNDEGDKERSHADMLPDGFNLEKNIIESLGLKVKIDALKAHISPRDFLMLKMRADGKTQDEIAEKIGLSQVQISRNLIKIKNIFVKIIDHYENGNPGQELNVNKLTHRKGVV